MSFYRTLVVSALLTLMTACSTGGPVDYPPLSFKHYQPFHMAVSSIEFIDEYPSPGHPPFIETTMDYSPSDAMRIWVRDRLHAAGGEKSLRVIVKEASVRATDTSEPLSIKTVFGDGPDARYDARLVVEIRAYGEGLMSEASMRITAERTLTVEESASLRDRRAAQRELIRQLMETANAELEKNLYEYMSNYISYSQAP